MYSTSIVERVVVVCNLDAHEIGHPAKHMIQPALDFNIMGLMGHPFAKHQQNLNLRSTQILSFVWSENESFITGSKPVLAYLLYCFGM